MMKMEKFKKSWGVMEIEDRVMEFVVVVTGGSCAVFFQNDLNTLFSDVCN